MSYLIQGPIHPNRIVDLYADVQEQTGANSIFLGSIRRDLVDGLLTAWIEYSAYAPMAEKVFRRIETHLRQKYTLHQLTIFHSIGRVNIGETSMLVYVQSKHRREAFKAVAETVDLVKAYAPVWKKEFYEDGSYDWVNCEGCQAHQHHHHDFSLSDH